MDDDGMPTNPPRRAVKRTARTSTARKPDAPPDAASDTLKRTPTTARAGSPRSVLGRRSRRRTPVEQVLAKVFEDGGVTLVVGAGASLTHGVPGWKSLVRQLWAEAWPESPLPESSPLEALPTVALERISARLGPDVFVERLRAHLYAGCTRPRREELLTGEDTLSVIARALVQEHARGPARRIQRVVSFNADDLLERACARLSPRKPVLRPVTRASHHPERGLGEQPIPCYHLHGYLPAPGSAPWHLASPDALVFTEAQYWRSVAMPLSFANRVMAFALHDTRCLFIGLSMTDLNVLRWLAARADEIEVDKRNQFSPREQSPSRIDGAVRRALERHFWIHTPRDDPGGHLGDHLETRGVRSVLLENGWQSDDLSRLFKRLLP